MDFERAGKDERTSTAIHFIDEFTLFVHTVYNIYAVEWSIWRNVESGKRNRATSQNEHEC